MDSKSDSKSNSKSDPKSDSKSDPKSDSKSDPKSDPKSDLPHQTLKEGLALIGKRHNIFGSSHMALSLTFSRETLDRTKKAILSTSRKSP